MTMKEKTENSCKKRVLKRTYEVSGSAGSMDNEVCHISDKVSCES